MRRGCTVHTDHTCLCGIWHCATRAVEEEEEENINDDEVEEDEEEAAADEEDGNHPYVKKEVADYQPEHNVGRGAEGHETRVHPGILKTSTGRTAHEHSKTGRSGGEKEYSLAAGAA